MFLKSSVTKLAWKPSHPQQAIRLKLPAPPEIAELNAKLDLEKAEVKRLKAKLQEITSIMDSSSVDVYNEYVDVHNQLGRAS